MYTINDESQHLLLFGVPSIKLEEEIKRECGRYGTVKLVKKVQNYPDTEEFTDLYHVQYVKLSSARLVSILW